MRIVLVNPVARNTAGYHTIGTRIPPLGLQVLAYLTPDHHTVELIDEAFGTDKTLDLLRAGQYDLAVITSYSSSAPRAYELAAFCKELGITTLMGGPHAWACPEEAKLHVDCLVIGECDSIWASIVNDAEAGRLAKRYDGELADLSAGYGRGDQSLQALNGKYDVACIQFSRGCPIGCDFCSVTKFNGRPIRRRPTEDILEEWNSIKKPFVFVVDDNFYGVSKQHAADAREILQAICQHGKKKHWFSQTSLNMGENHEDLKLAYRSGCRAMLVGIESFNEENLKAWGKGLNRKLLNDYQRYIDGFHKAGLAVLGGFVIGTEFDTEDTAADTLLKAVQLGVDIIQVTNMTPLPGTNLYDNMMAEGTIHATNYPEDWERYTFIETVYNPQRMTAEQLDLCMYEIRKLAAKRGWVWRRTWNTLKNTRSITTSLFVHGMNTAWRKLALALRDRDQQLYGHYQIPKSRIEKLQKAFRNGE